jgi:hypothetical protein
MRHLSPDEFVDALDGFLDSGRAGHVERCSSCRTEVERLQALLQESSQVEVPEPSPLFWTHFSRRVHEGIAAENVPGGGLRRVWLRWAVLAPAAALLLMMIAWMSALPGDSLEQPPTVVANPAPDAADDLARLGEREWAVLSEIVGPVDLDVAHEAGFVSLGDADRALQQLDAAEQRELLRLIEEEIGKAGG